MTEVWSKRLLIIAAGWSFLGAGTALLYPSQYFTTLFWNPPSLRSVDDRAESETRTHA